MTAISGQALFDAIVTDIRIPGPNGWALARHARMANPLIAVIYISGDSSADHPAEGVSDSVMLSKPFLPQALVSAVSQSLCI